MFAFPTTLGGRESGWCLTSTTRLLCSSVLQGHSFNSGVLFMCLYDFALVPDWLSVCECVHLAMVVRSAWDQVRI